MPARDIADTRLVLRKRTSQASCCGIDSGVVGVGVGGCVFMYVLVFVFRVLCVLIAFMVSFLHCVCFCKTSSHKNNLNFHPFIWKSKVMQNLILSD